MDNSRYDPKERVGVNSVESIFLEDIEWIFREQPIEDVGIDAHVEVVNKGNPTGRLIALQIKSGASYFEEKTKEGYVYRGTKKHLDYWLNHSLPVLIVLYSFKEKVAYWQFISEQNVSRTGKGWKILIPFENTLGKLVKTQLETIANECPDEEFVTTKKYSNLSLSDVAHGMAKRYSAEILIYGKITKPIVKQVIKEVTENLQWTNYYRSTLVKNRWSDEPAHVVWLYIYATMDDAANNNWICMTQWISDTLSSEFAPSTIEGNDYIDKIVIEWSDEHQEITNILDSLTLSKEDYLENIKPILKQVIGVMSEVKKLGIDLQKWEVNEMKSIAPVLGDLDRESANIGLPPLECKDLDIVFRSLMCSVGNIALFFSEKGLVTWSEKNRNYLVKSNMESFEKDYKRLEFELEKVLR